MKRTNVHLPEPVIKRLRALAKRKDVSFAELVRAAIERYLAEQGA